MEADLVRLGGMVAIALAGAHVHQDRCLVLQQCLAQRAVQGDQIVSGHRPHIGDAQILEEPTRLRQIHHRVAYAP